MTRQRIVLLGAAALLIGGCAHTRSSAEQTPMDEVILGYKRALVLAQEKSLFEEFVKFRKLGNTFALYSVTELDITAATTLKKTNSTKGEVSIKWPLEAGISAGKSIEVGDERGANVAVKLTPIGNAPKAYEAVRAVFSKPEFNNLFGLVYFDSSGNPSDKAAAERCRVALYCVPISCIRDESGNQAFAYLAYNAYSSFRSLLDEIRKIDPGTASDGKEK